MNQAGQCARGGGVMIWVGAGRGLEGFAAREGARAAASVVQTDRVRSAYADWVCAAT